MKKLLFLLILQFFIPRTSPGGELYFKFRSLRFEVTSNYDDNILRYSERDIDRFIDRTEISPSKISTNDDWKNDARLKFYFDGPKVLRKPIKFRYFFKYSSYLRNSFKNYLNHSVYISQEVGKIVDVELMYFNMPGYYLREYNDKDINEYHSCDFDDERIRLGFSVKPIKQTVIGLQFEFETLYYNKYFTEYDSESRFLNLYVTQKIGKDFTVTGNYGFMKSDNVGYIPIVASLVNPGVEEDSEYGDSSYDEDIYEISLRYRLRSESKKNTDFSLQYKLRNRFYTTDNSLESDPFHAGREDNRHRITFEIDRELSKSVDAGIIYVREWRKVESLNQTVKDIKEFTQNNFAFTMTFKIF